MTCCSKSDFLQINKINKLLLQLVNKLQEAGKIKNSQLGCGVFVCSHPPFSWVFKKCMTSQEGKNDFLHEAIRKYVQR